MHSSHISELHCSRKLGGAAEHLIDGNEKHICQLSFEFKSLHVIERHSNSFSVFIIAHYLQKNNLTYDGLQQSNSGH